MFETTDHAEIAIPAEFQSHGERAWAYVFRRVHISWFHVVYSVPADQGVSLAQVLFLADVDHLVDLDQNGGGKILEVQIVSPRHLNGTDRWTMTPLREIWIGNEPSAPAQIARIFVLQTGERYVDSGLDTPETDLIDRRRLFHAPTTRKRREKSDVTGHA